MCYYCPYVTGSSASIVQHEVRRHHVDDKLSIRHKVPDPTSGILSWQSVHFKITLGELVKMNCTKLIIDMDARTLRQKREANDDIAHNDQPTDSEFLQSVKMSYTAMEEQGRGNDFMAALNAIGRRTLSVRNITVQLFLDIGAFLSVASVSNVRYNPLTMNFWSTVYKLFKGKALRFFRGSMASGDDGKKQASNTEDCAFNMIVPSAKAVRKHISTSHIHTEKPGVITSTLDAFADTHNKSEMVKLSIDGKKLAYGVGNLGEEDLAGHERSPILEERRARLSTEIDSIQAIYDSIDLDLVRIDEQSLDKKDILCVISKLSTRIRELNVASTIKKRALNTVRAKAGDDWKTSQLAASISFLQSKLIQYAASIKALLQCVDDFGYAVASINGTHVDYIRGIGSKVHMNEQMNYQCLKVFTDDVYNSLSPGEATLVKQHSQKWFDMRNSALVTGSTWFGALGLETLAQQKKYFSKVYSHTWT